MTEAIAIFGTLIVGVSGFALGFLAGRVNK